MRNSCKKKLLFKRMPILAWLPNYQKKYVVSDMVAGITVGLTVIPQAIAYANVAGLPLQVNLLRSFGIVRSQISIWFVASWINISKIGV